MQNLDDCGVIYPQDESWTYSESQVAVRLGVRKEPCVVCGLPVFLAEKLVISRSLYHRTCFRCARCNNQLTLGNYYETEEGRYCCETCPDEEIAAATTPTMHQDYNQTALFGGRETNLEYQSTYKRALSDEEKSSKRSSVVPRDALLPSADRAKDFEKDQTLSGVAKIRMNFMTSHLLESGDQQNDHSAIVPPNVITTRESPHPVDNECKAPDESDHINAADTTPETKRGSGLLSSPLQASPSIEEYETLAIVDAKKNVSVNKDEPEDSFSHSFKDNHQRPTATAITHTHDIDSTRFLKKNLSKDEDTKETHAGDGLSLVQRRMKIFESSLQKDDGEEEPSSFVNITTKKSSREIDKVTEDKITDKISSETTGQESFSQTKKETSNQNSSANIDVEYESVKPLELKEDTAITAASILKKMIDDQQPDTSLSNASGIDLSANSEYPEDLNPFQSDDSDRGEEDSKNAIPRSSVSNKSEKYVSTNPFGSSDDDEEKSNATPPRPAARKNSSVANKGKEEPPTRRKLQAPQISLNPFWSDDEEHDSDDDSPPKSEIKNTTPVPKPRKLKQTPEPSPVPRKTSLDRGGMYASNSSITSTGSSVTPGGTCRKKKPAPPPPPSEEIFSTSSTFDTLVIKSPDDLQSAKTSPRTPRARKMKPAPPPPMSTSTPQSITDPFTSEVVKELEESNSAIWDDQKNSKDETNRNRQSLSTISNIDDSSQLYSAPFIDKSAQGKWKRKKGPAPPRPLPHKRKIKVMSVKDVKLELDEIELQQQGLEKQGVRLEQLIRDKCETGQENEEFTSLRVDVEELVLELFALVNEKNELFRRQAELMLLRRQQRLEEEHADVEYQIRCLMSQPEATKTDSDKQREESLIQRLVEIVERRNEIVECLEMDRRREVEEDRSINEQMGLFAAKSKGDLIADTDGFRSSSIPKKEKAKDKVKEKKVKKSHKAKDADKDVDETEMKLKRHKKKWF